jgi:hypothetical protein
LGKTRNGEVSCTHFDAESARSIHSDLVHLFIVAITATLFKSDGGVFLADAVVLRLSFKFLGSIYCSRIFYKSDLSLDAVIKFFAAGFLIAVLAFFFEGFLVNIILIAACTNSLPLPLRDIFLSTGSLITGI